MASSRVSEIAALLLCITTMTGGGPSSALDNKPPAGSRVEIAGRTLSAVIEETSVESVLREVGRQAGFEVEIRGDLGRVRPQVFQALPIDEGIRRLVGDNRVNLIMRYEVDEAGERRVVEVDARAAGEIPAEFLEQRRMRDELARIGVPPPPPPPPVE